MERAGRYSRWLVALNLLWLATIVFLPVPTALLFSQYSKTHEDLVADAMYIGALLVGVLCMRLIQLEIALHCRVEGQPPLERWRLATEWITVALMAAALVLSCAGLGARALLIVILTIPVQLAITRAHRRADRRRGADGT